MLDQSVIAWNTTYNNGFITPDAAISGTGAGRDVSISPPANCTANGESHASKSFNTQISCQAIGTYAGGVFYVTVDPQLET